MANPSHAAPKSEESVCGGGFATAQPADLVGWKPRTGRGLVRLFGVVHESPRAEEGLFR